MDLPNLRGHRGKDGGGHDQFVHEREAEAFLPRHYTRGKDGAPADTVPAITKESDRGDGMAVVHVASIHPDAVGHTGEAKTPSPDAEGRVRLRDAGLGVRDDGVSYTLKGGAPPGVGPVGSYNVTPGRAGEDEAHVVETDVAEAVVRKTGNRSDRGTIIDVIDRELHEALERHGWLAPVPFDPSPDGARYAAMGDAVTVHVAEWVGVRLMHALALEEAE